MATTTTNFSLTKPAVNSATDEDLWGGQWNTNADLIDSLFAVRTADYNFADYDLERANFIDCSEQAYDAGNLSGAVTLDYTNGHWQYGTLIGNVTSLTVNNWPASGTVGRLSVRLTQDGTGGRTLALGGAYKTVGGAGIALSTAAAAVDILRLETPDAGTSVYTFLNGGMA